MKKFLLLLVFISTLFSLEVKSAIPCSRVTGPYSEGDILNASDYDAELNNIVDCFVNGFPMNGGTVTGNFILDGNQRIYDAGDLTLYSDSGTTKKFEVDGTTGNVSLFGGADLFGYSDAGSIIKFSLDSSTGAAILGITQAGEITNCSISNSGTTFSISGYEGTALSATNPCVVAIRSPTSGRVTLSTFTSNVTFTHGSSSDTDGNLFGISEANWANEQPFFIGLVTDGSSSFFTISRVPINQTGAASTDICQKGDTDCDAQNDVMILTTGLTLSSWVNLPITQVGWFKMTYATSGNAWTASVSTKTGFNSEYEKERWNFVTGQMGADSGKFFDASSSTTPSWATPANIVYAYWIDRTGRVGIEFSTRAASSCTNGTGTDQIALASPYRVTSTVTADLFAPAGYVRLGATDGLLALGISNGITTFLMYDSIGGTVLANEFSNTADDVQSYFSFKIF